MSGFTIVTKDSAFYERSLVYGLFRPRRCQVKIPRQGILLVYQISRYPIAGAHTMLVIRLPEDIEARLESLAKRTGRSKTFYAREAILVHLEDLEDLYLAEQVVQRMRKGEERTSTLEEVEARLGLAD